MHAGFRVKTFRVRNQELAGITWRGNRRFCSPLLALFGPRGMAPRSWAFEYLPSLPKIIGVSPFITGVMRNWHSTSLMICGGWSLIFGLLSCSCVGQGSAGTVFGPAWPAMIKMTLADSCCGCGVFQGCPFLQLPVFKIA